MVRRLLLLFLAGILLPGSSIHGFEILDFEVPPHVNRSTNVTLTCNHDLKPHQLFVVNWLFNNVLFFQYFPVDGKALTGKTAITLDLERSTNTSVVLTDVKISASGLYKCQVIGEVPIVQRMERESNMTVVVIPNEKPVIGPLPKIGLDSFSPGMRLKINCTSAPSIPASKLQWIINNKKVGPKFLRQYPVNVSQSTGLMITTLGLDLTLNKFHFKKGALQIKCTSTIFTLYNHFDEQNSEGQGKRGELRVKGGAPYTFSHTFFGLLVWPLICWILLR